MGQLDNAIETSRKQKASAQDSLRVIGAIQESLNKAEYGLKNSIIASKGFNKDQDPVLSQISADINERKIRYQHIDNELADLKVTIPGHNFKSVVFDTYGQLDNYISGLSAKPMTLTLKEAGAMVINLDNEIEDTYNKVLRMSSSAIENDITTAHRLNSVMQYGEYPSLYRINLESSSNRGDYYSARALPKKDPYTKGIESRVHLGNFSALEAIDATPEGFWFHPSSDTELPEDINITSQVMGLNIKNDPPYYSTDVWSFPEHSSQNDSDIFNRRDIEMGLRNMIRNSIGEKDIITPGYNKPRHEVESDIEFKIKKDLTKMQWLTKQKHEILCRTVGTAEYCGLTTGTEDENLNDYVYNLKKEQEGIRSYIQDQEEEFDSYITQTYNNLGLSSNNNPTSSDYYNVRLNIVEDAWEGLKKEAREIDSLYITKGMAQFYMDIKNDKRQLAAIFDDIVK